MSNLRFTFERTVLEAPEELDVHIWCAQGFLRIHLQVSTDFGFLDFFSRWLNFFEHSGPVECHNSGFLGAKPDLSAGRWFEQLCCELELHIQCEESTNQYSIHTKYEVITPGISARNITTPFSSEPGG